VLTHHTCVVQQHVKCITQLSAYGGEPQHGVHGFGIACDGGGAEVLDELADAHQLARRTELLLGRLIRRDGGLWAVRAVEIPCEETGEVLKGTQDLVAADYDGVSMRVMFEGLRRGCGEI
jgi:hypothetical protein